MKITLVLHDACKGWIIEKLAHKLRDALVAAGADVEVASAPSSASQINHFMIFHYVEVCPGTINTVAVTHIDDALKLDMITRQLSQGVRAMVCMSHMTQDQVVNAGADPAKVTYALPAHDGLITPRRILIGITSNCYSDHRKREWLLHKLAEDMPLDGFEFHFYGSGWDDTVSKLAAGGAKVQVFGPSDDYLADYAAIRKAVPRFDYYFYPGLDEGSMGTLDAVAAGVKTIVTLQGFHLDLPNGITQGFWDYPELFAIFKSIAADRQGRIDTGAMLTWERYARRHLDIWSELLASDDLPGPDLLGDAQPTAAPAPFPIVGYGDILKNDYRRQMALQFWIPGLYNSYRRARSKLGGLRRKLIGSA